MATRTFRNFVVKAIFGAEIKAMRDEFNKVVEEVEEVKTKLAAHTHTLPAHTHDGVTTGSSASGAITTGAGAIAAPATITYAQPDAKKIS